MHCYHASFHIDYSQEHAHIWPCPQDYSAPTELSVHHLLNTSGQCRLYTLYHIALAEHALSCHLQAFPHS